MKNLWGPLNTSVAHLPWHILLAPKILHNLCFSFLLGITAIPREIENNAYAKFWGQIGCIIGDVQVAYRRGGEYIVWFQNPLFHILRQKHNSLLVFHYCTCICVLNLYCHCHKLSLCHYLSPFQLPYFSKSCHLLEFYPNRASIISNGAQGETENWMTAFFLSRNWNLKLFRDEWQVKSFSHAKTFVSSYMILYYFFLELKRSPSKLIRIDFFPFKSITLTINILGFSPYN